MAKDFPVKVRLSAIDKLTAPLNRITNAFPNFDRAVKKSSQAMRIFNKETAQLQKDYAAVGGKLKTIGMGMTAAITLPVVAGAALSAKAFMDYETALIGVGKTTDMKGKDLENLGARFRQMAKEIPVPITELLNMGQVAAQLGVKGSDDLVKFTETMAKLSKATNIAGEEGAINLARFIGVTKGSMKDVDRFGSAIVDLGNNFKLQEAELLTFSTRLGTSTALFKPAGHQVLGMATAMASMGIQAELGSSATQRGFLAIQETIAGGGKKMEAFSRLTGIASKDLKQAFQTDSTAVFKAFIKGLGSMGGDTAKVTKALEVFGLTGVGNVSVLGALASNSDLLTEALEKSKLAFDDNNALEKEFSSFMKSRENQLALTKQRFNDLAITIGERMAPAIDMALGLFNRIANFLQANPWALDLSLAIAGITAVIGPVVLGFGTLLTLFPTMIAGWVGLKLAMVSFGTAVSAAFLPVTAAILAFIAAYKTGEYIMDKFGGGGGFGAYLAGKMGPSDDEIDAQAANSVSAGIARRRSGLEAATVVNKEFSQRTNNARVDINVKAPQSTSVIGDSVGGILSINRGAAGAF